MKWKDTDPLRWSNYHNGSKGKLDWRMTAGACQRMRQMSFFVFRKSNVSKSKNRKTFRLQRPLGDRTNLHKLKHLDRAITRWRSHDPSVSGVRKDTKNGSNLNCWKRSEAWTPLKMSLRILCVFLSFWTTMERDIDRKIDCIKMHLLKEVQ